MTERNVMGARTYLEMRDPSQLARAPLPDADWRIDPFISAGQVYGEGAPPWSHVRVAGGAGLTVGNRIGPGSVMVED